MRSDKKDIEWYNRHYEKETNDLAPWYRFLIPGLQKYIGNDARVLEIGCGHSMGLRHMIRCGIIKERNVAGIDQSDTAVHILKKKIPKADIRKGDAYNLEFKDSSVDVGLLMEVI